MVRTYTTILTCPGGAADTRHAGTRQSQERDTLQQCILSAFRITYSPIVKAYSPFCCTSFLPSFLSVPFSLTPRPA
eukprot:scaffold681768_cov83-Prasinocladus_malaysianus.AAC.1